MALSVAILALSFLVIVSRSSRGVGRESRGGGSAQCKPFVLYPAEWGLDQNEIVGAEKLHQLFKRKLHSVQAKPQTR